MSEADPEADPEPDPRRHDAASDGTLYWTLSLYVAAEDLPEIYKAKFGENPGELLRQKQLAHLPSLALRNAIDPLFNDIADRDFFGRPRDFLFAAGMRGRSWTTLGEAAGLLLDEMPLEFVLPEHFSWVTEGTRFHCNLEHNEPRRLVLRRFWFAHSDGALSYHLSFAHHYGALAKPYGVETYYFLSLLQKLAAPKEFMLDEALLQALGGQGAEARFDPLPGTGAGEALGIAPFDITVTPLRDGTGPLPFWHFVHDLFVKDARELFTDVFGLADAALPASLSSLLKPVDVIEVPGLRLPRCRYLFHIDDKRFFEFLLPVDPATKESLPRKKMVRDQCYRQLADKIDTVLRPHGRMPNIALIGGPAPTDEATAHLPWATLDQSADYEEWRKEGVFKDAEGEIFRDAEALETAIRTGQAIVEFDDDDNSCPPRNFQVPAYRIGRADCVDYMFLAGFNQNIIDWLNQDTSEILDSIDPIYPTEDVQADERFFVRYANHRGMITYVAGSRSLEIGNDYIGTCPYAFLIHVLSMHNEFLARDHEQRTDKALEEIDRGIQRLHGAEESRSGTAGGPNAVTPRTIEDEINRLKRSTYRDYERHRYLKVFRYDTEAMVFEKLSELRGTDWRGVAMERALETLEEYAADIAQRHTEATEKRMGALIGTVGLLSGTSLLFSLSEYFEKHVGPAWAGSGGPFWSYVFGNFAWILAVLGLLVFVRLASVHFGEIWETLWPLLWPKKPPPPQ